MLALITHECLSVQGDDLLRDPAREEDLVGHEHLLKHLQLAAPSCC